MLSYLFVPYTEKNKQPYPITTQKKKKKKTKTLKEIKFEDTPLYQFLTKDPPKLF